MEFTRDFFEKEITTEDALYNYYKLNLLKTLSELYYDRDNFKLTRIRVLIPVLDCVNSDINTKAISKIFNDFNWIGCLIRKMVYGSESSPKIVEKNQLTSDEDITSFGVDLWLKKPDSRIEKVLKNV